MRQILFASVLAVTASMIMATGAAAAPMTGDPLHGFCYSPTPACSDNGTNTPTSANPPNFGFTVSPGPQTGDFLLEILVPNSDDPSPAAVSFIINGTQGGPMNDLPISATATLINPSAWTTGDLDSFLGFDSSPANPIGAFLPSTQALVPSATGFYVYQADLGVNRLQDNPSALAGPLLNINSTGFGFSPELPLASYAVGFLHPHTFIGTANSGALFIRRVPEPGSLALLGVGLVVMGVLRRRRSG